MGFIVWLRFVFIVVAIFESLPELGKFGLYFSLVIVTLIVLGVGHALLCANVWRYGEKVVPPEISIDFKNGFLTNSDTEPLLGEEITCGDKENYFVILTDHKIYVDDYDKTPDLEIKIVPENATPKKADATLKITQVAMSNPPSWIASGNLKDQVTTLDKNFNYVIDGSRVRYNESSDVEPTVYRIVAKNKRGETSVTLTVTRYPLYKACELYSATHPDSSAIADVALCRERAEYNEKHQLPSGSSSSGGNSSSTGSSNFGSQSGTSHSGSTCIHYENGRCWDEIEDWDKNYGTYGDGYAPPAVCTGICLDIYEDAYYKGYGEY